MEGESKEITSEEDVQETDVPSEEVEVKSEEGAKGGCCGGCT